MKKILGVLIILVVFLGIYSIYQIGNAFSSDIPDIAIEENIDKIDNIIKENKVQKNENVSEQIKNVQTSDVKTSLDGYKNDKKVNISGSKGDIGDNNVKHEEINNDNNIQNDDIQSNNEQSNNQIELRKEEQKNEESKENSSKYEVYTVNGIIQEFTIWDDCKKKSIEVAFESDVMTMCYESYTNSSNQKVYRIQINY